MGSIKVRNGMDLTEAEDIKKRWQEYTDLYKKELHDSDNHDGVITHLEPDILKLSFPATFTLFPKPRPFSTLLLFSPGGQGKCESE